MKIVDLAEVIAPEAKHEIIGIRPGEKINEILLTKEEARHAKEFEDHFVIEPEHPFWDKSNPPPHKEKNYRMVLNIPVIIMTNG